MESTKEPVVQLNHNRINRLQQASHDAHTNQGRGSGKVIAELGKAQERESI
jgi:hypothetical protein